MVSARFAGVCLIVDGAERAQIAVSALTARAGGFNHDTLFLGWFTNGVAYSLQAADAAAQAVLLAEAPATLRPQLRGWRGGQRRQTWAWRALFGAVAGLLLALVLAWSQYGRLVDWLARQVPIETEAALGAASLEQLRGSTRLIEQGLAADAVKTIGNQLTQGSRYSYHWAIKPDKTVNAFAMPGGYVVVHTGLIEAAKSADELAGVLAHEVQHIEQRHTLKGMIHSLGWASLLTLVLGDLSAVSGALAYEAGQLSFSRDLEREADRLGVQALAAAKIDPAGMASFFRSMAASQAGAIALLSSHPATNERIAAIEADIAALPKREFTGLAIDWPAVQAAAKTAD